LHKRSLICRPEPLGGYIIREIAGGGGVVDLDVYPGTSRYATVYGLKFSYWCLYFMVNAVEEIWYYITDHNAPFPPAKSEWRKISVV